nr:putative nuclease HARBI1 [Tanacetum cinerariifolium]
LSVLYVVNGVEYRNGYYLADGIYPEWASFVKSFTVTTDPKHTYFKQRQESARKDVECAFDVLQRRWGLIQQPARAYEVSTLRRIMYAGIIMHNMILEDQNMSIVDLNHVYSNPARSMQQCGSIDVKPNVRSVWVEDGSLGGHPRKETRVTCDPTTAMNMALTLMAKAFKLNYLTPTNNNQRISSNTRNRQIAQPGMNMGQDRQMQMVGGNGGNQFRQYAGQNVGNLAGYNDVIGNQVIQNAVQNPKVQNVGNQNGLIGVQGNRNQNQIENGNLVAARAKGNAAGQNGNQIRCYNYRGVGHYARNYTVRPRRRDAAYLQTQLLIAQKEEAGIQLQAEEYDLMAAAADLDEIEEVNANCILMANLQQASTSGTQTDSALVYDTDGSAEVHENCDDNEIFNMFTQEEQYTELLERITSKETLQLAQESCDKMKQMNKEIKPANYTKINHLSGVFVPQTALSREDLYFLNNSQTANVLKSFLIPNEDLSDDTTPSVARKFLNEVKSTILTLQRVVKQRMTIETHNCASSAHQELHKIVRDEKFSIVNQVDARLQNFEIQFLKEAAKFVGDFKSLAKEADASLAKHKALKLEIERLLKAVVSQDIMIIVQYESVVDT